jgi:hypothetical protein
MQLKPTIERFGFLLITGLLCVFSVGLSQHSLTKYNIPFAGWILAAAEYRLANVTYWQAINKGVFPYREYDAALAAYGHTQVALLSTLAFVAFSLVVINCLWRRNAATP